MTTRLDQRTAQLLTAATADGSSDIFLAPQNFQGNAVMSADINGSGSVSATVTYYGSIDGSNWYTLGSAISLSGTNAASGSTNMANQPWPLIKATLTSISGTDAAVDAWIAVH